MSNNQRLFCKNNSGFFFKHELVGLGIKNAPIIISQKLKLNVSKWQIISLNSKKISLSVPHILDCFRYWPEKIQSQTCVIVKKQLVMGPFIFFNYLSVSSARASSSSSCKQISAKRDSEASNSSSMLRSSSVSSEISFRAWIIIMCNNER